MEIQEIKARLSMKDVLAHYNLVPNRNNHINCPFHDDKTPSMKVFEDSNTLYCFSGNCKTHGHSLDVIDLVMKKENCTKHEAILKCVEMIGMPVNTAPVTVVLTLEKVWESFKNGLTICRKAQKYLQSRGLNYLNLEIGYNSGQLHHRKSEDFVQGLEKLGLLVLNNNTRRVWAKDCVIFPLKNADGNVVSLYGRSLEKGHFYLSGRCGLYPCHPSKKAKRIILTESVIDAASLLQIKSLKEYEILALYGTNGLTGEHLTALKSCPELVEIILMLDGDAAGAAASAKYQKELGDMLPKVAVRIVELPKDTDVNELWSNHLSEDLFLELLQLKEETLPLVQPQSETTKPHELCTDNPNNLIYKGSHAMFFVKGFGGLKHQDSLKITLVCEDERERKYRSKVELYEDKEVRKYCREASEKLGVSEDLLDIDISLLTDKLEGYRNSLERSEKSAKTGSLGFKLSPENRREAIEFLKAPGLFLRLNEMIGKTGIVGEINTRLLLLIVASSYKCKDTLHALIQGSTGTGKTLLLRKVMDMIPEISRHVWTRVSDKSLYHAGEKYKHSSIAIEDWDGLSIDVQYVIREMQTGKRLSCTITVKGADGKMGNAEILAEGPIATLMCTTHGAVYEDNMSRCLLVAIDESEEQTERILDYQYRKDRGEINDEEEDNATQFIQNMVYILEPLEVVNPFAGKVKLPPSVHKIRRLNQLFQSFVKQITWWHQFQRKKDSKGKLITEKEDVHLAIDLLFETIILKVDELDGSLRQFFEQLKEYVLKQEEKEKYRFERRELRKELGVRKSQLHNYLQALSELEYIKQMGGYANKGFVYQIVYWDDNQRLRKEIKDFMTNQLNQL